MNESSERDYLAQLASLQDTLLQNYRSLLMFFQSIFAAIGVGLAIAALTIDDFPLMTIERFVIVIMLLSAGIIHITVTHKLQRVIFARGRDVNIAHRMLIVAENRLAPLQRHFTAFKIEQKVQRNRRGAESPDNELKNMFLSNKIVTIKDAVKLVQEGLGHTRKVIDKLIVWTIWALWAIYLPGGAFLIYYNIVNKTMFIKLCY